MATQSLLVRGALAASAFLWTLLSHNLAAQDVEYYRPYESAQASADATRYFDARNRRDIARQLDLIDQMKWYSALPAAGLGAAYYRDPPSLDYVYGTSQWSAYGPYGGAAWSIYPDVFEPWPYVPGDIFGYRWYNPAPQPVGRVELQTGPNRWESHPVYAPSENPPPSTLPRPPVEKSPAAPGPREF